MKTLLITVITVFALSAAIPCALADDEATAVEEVQARIDKAKSWLDNIERDINKELAKDAEATNPNAEKFRTMLVHFLQYGITIQGKNFDELELTDIYMCAVAVCDKVNAKELLELKLLFAEENIAKGINDLKQVIPNAVANSAMGSHWTRARNLMRIAMRHIKK